MEQKDNIKTKNKYLICKYGITSEDWLIMYEQQLGVCAICKSKDASKRLCVDHIHVKGFKNLYAWDKRDYVRGLLCFLCNTAIKGFDKTVNGKINRQRLNGTYEYFTKYPLKGEI